MLVLTGWCMALPSGLAKNPLAELISKYIFPIFDLSSVPD